MKELCVQTWDFLGPIIYFRSVLFHINFVEWLLYYHMQKLLYPQAQPYQNMASNLKLRRYGSAFISRLNVVNRMHFVKISVNSLIAMEYIKKKRLQSLEKLMS